MFARIIPFRKLSRNLESFDYIYETPLKVGSIVEINFKGKKVKGVVDSLHNTKPKFKVKKIISKIDGEAYNENQLYCLKNLARLSFISPGTLLHITNEATKTPVKSKGVKEIKNYIYTKSELDELRELIDSSHQIETSRRLQLAIIKLIAKKYGKTLVICPNKATEAELEGIFRTNILKIGSRKELIKPIHYKAIVLFEASHPDYSLTNQNPNFSNTFICEMYSEKLKIPFFALGETLNPQELTDVLKITDKNSDKMLKIVNMHQDRRSNFSDLVAKSTEESIMDTLQKGKNVLIFANAEGSSESTFGKIALQKQLSSNPLMAPFAKNIKVVTEGELRNEIQGNYSLVIDIAFDLHQQNALNGEHEQRFKLMRILNSANENSADVLIQTYSPELIDSMLSASYHKKTQDSLKKLSLPPYSGLITLQKGKNSLPEGAIKVDKNKYVLYYNCDAWDSLYETLRKQDHKIHHQTPKYAHSCTTQPQPRT